MSVRVALKYLLVYGTDNAPRVAGWGTPASIYSRRFVRLNFTINY
jgi:hypothetical protein